jgi:hypothetical protein
MAGRAAAILFLTTALFGAETEIPETPYESDYAKGQPDRQLWRDVKDSFLRHRFSTILKKNNLALSCARCASVFMDVSFAVNEQGGAEIRGIDRKKACAGEFPKNMETAFLKFLRDYPYPKLLHGTRVRLRLGNSLKC